MSKLFKFDIKNQLSRNLVQACSDCDDETIPIGYGDPCTEYTEEYGWDDMWMALCAFRFTDPTDIAEWTAGQDTASLRKFPAGIVDFPAASSTAVAITGSRRKITTPDVHTFTYTTFEMSTDSADCVFMEWVRENVKNLRFFWKDMNGKFRFAKDFASAVITMGSTAAISPGFLVSITSKPQKINGEGNLCTWVMTGELVVKEVFQDVYIAGISETV